MESLLAQLPEFLVSEFARLGINLSPSARQAVFIILGVFLFALVFGVARRHMLSWSIKGAWFGITFGILLTLVVEAFLLVGGRTVVVEALRWENTPKVVRETLNLAISDLAKSLSAGAPVLSAQEEINSQEFLALFGSLPEGVQEEVTSEICKESPR